jgi:protein PhnA
MPLEVSHQTNTNPVGCKDASHPTHKELYMPTRDTNGTELLDGDSVQVIKDLKVKGTSSVLKRGTLIKNIRLTDDEDLIECNADKIKGLVLRVEFLKKV